MGILVGGARGNFPSFSLRKYFLLNRIVRRARLHKVKLSLLLNRVQSIVNVLTVSLCSTRRVLRALVIHKQIGKILRVLDYFTDC